MNKVQALEISFELGLENQTLMPFFYESISAGFASPAEGREEKRVTIQELLDLDRFTIPLTVSGDSMTGAGINDSDILIVKKNRTPTNGDIIIARVFNEYLVKTYDVKSGTPRLLAHNPRYPCLIITDEMDFIKNGRKTL